MNRLVLLLLDAISWFFWKLGIRRAIAFGRMLGSFVFHVVRIRRGVVLENLAHAFPEKSEAERLRIARDCYRQLGRIVAEVFFLPRLTKEQVSSLIRFHDQQGLDAAIAKGGIVFCMGHIGNWELLGYEGSRRGYRFHAITKKLKGPINEWLHRARSRVFGELPPSGSFEDALALLAKGEAIALIVDQHRHGDKAVPVNFMGRRAATSPAPALFSLRTGAPVFAAWMTLGPDDVYDLRFKGPFEVPDAPTLTERLQKHSQLLASDLEATIREHPAEWFWVHRRWKLAEAEARAAEKQAALAPGGST